MRQFFVKLIPPRPTFHLDMSDHEKNLMQHHALYWKELLAQGTALIFGPVLDPKGVYGMGVIEAEDQDHVRLLCEHDPTVQAHLNSFEIAPMNATIKRA